MRVKKEQKKFTGWIISLLLVATIIVIVIVINRYFLCAPFIINNNTLSIDKIHCTEQFNFWKTLIWANSQDVNASSAETIFWARLSSPEEPLNIRNLLLGFAGIVGLGLAGWRSWVGERQAKAIEDRRIDERREEERNEERRLDERFANAVKSLSQPLNGTSYPAHLGAITALRDLAFDSQQYTQRCLDILCSCNQWMDGYLEKFADPNQEDCYAIRHLTEKDRIAPNKSKRESPITLEQELRSQQALIAIAYAIKKIGIDYTKKYLLEELDFSGKMLCGIDLSASEIAGINLKRTYLNGADLGFADLQKAELLYAKMRGAKLAHANLQDANLFNVEFHMANLDFAQMQRADMRTALLYLTNMNSVNLQGANLSYTSLQATYLANANLKGASMVSAQLWGTMLLGANMQEVSLIRTYFMDTMLLGCNLYGAKTKNHDLDHILFDEISEQSPLKSKQKQDNLINLIRHEFPDHVAAASSLINKKQNSWHNTYKGEESGALGDLKKSTVLEKDPKGNWIIKPSNIKHLKKFYHYLAYELSNELNIPAHQIISLISARFTSYKFLDEEYTKMQKTLVKIWKGLEKELKAKKKK